VREKLIIFLTKTKRKVRMKYFLLGLILNSSAFPALADQVGPAPHFIRITFVNGGITSTLENLALAESKLQEEAIKVCGPDVKTITVTNESFKIGPACGYMALEQSVLTEPLRNQVSQVEATAEVQCSSVAINE